MKTKKLNIKAILFDLGNVLVFYDTRRASKAFAEAFGVSEEELWKALFLSDVERAYTTGEITSKEFFKRINAIFPSKLTFSQFADIWNEIFTENSEMVDLVKSLKMRYPLYLISNTNDLHFEYIRETYSILEHFTKCFPSHQVRRRKPDPEIFRHVLSEIKLKPSEVIFIDDMPEFVESARSVGIYTIQFSSRKALEIELKSVGVLTEKGR